MPGSGLAAPVQVDVAGKESGKALGSTWSRGGAGQARRWRLCCCKPGILAALLHGAERGGQQCHRPRPPHCQPCRGTQAPLPPPPQGHSLAFPGGQKGTVRMGVQAGQGEAAGCWGAALTSSAFTPTPSFCPPSPGHRLPPRPAPPGMWHSREQLSWFRCCMETQLPCQGSRAAAVAVQPPTAPTACGSTRK